MQAIPLIAVPAQSLELTIQGAAYVLSVVWNETDKAYWLSLTQGRTPLLTNHRVVTKAPVLNAQGMSWDLVCLPLGDEASDAEPGLQAWGNTHGLFVV